MCSPIDRHLGRRMVLITPQALVLYPPITQGKDYVRDIYIYKVMARARK